jgi:hypothetical protein
VQQCEAQRLLPVGRDREQRRRDQHVTRVIELVVIVLLRPGGRPRLHDDGRVTLVANREDRSARC